MVLVIIIITFDFPQVGTLSCDHCFSAFDLESLNMAFHSHFLIFHSLILTKKKKKDVILDSEV